MIGGNEHSQLRNNLTREVALGTLALSIEFSQPVSFLRSGHLSPSFAIHHRVKWEFVANASVASGLRPSCQLYARLCTSATPTISKGNETDPFFLFVGLKQLESVAE